MDLVDAHDILRPGHTNDQTVKDFLNSIQSFQCLTNCEPKQLQQFSSGINNCLNSPSQQDKYNALCALGVLVEQCSPEYFSQNIGSFINSIVNQVFKSQKALQSEKTCIIDMAWWPSADGLNAVVPIHRLDSFFIFCSACRGGASTIRR